jgi:hypothetical protein
MSESTDELQRGKLAQSILATCAAKFGGVGPLSVHLGVREDDLLNWIAGQRIPPVEVVRKAIEPFLGRQ